MSEQRMTEEIDVSAVRAVCEAASPAPWCQWAGKGWPDAAKIVLGEDLVTGVWWPLRLESETQDDRPLVWCRETRDQEFVAVARRTLPVLCNEVDTLRAKLAEVERERDEAVEAFNVHHESLVAAYRERDEARAGWAKADGDAMFAAYEAEARGFVACKEMAGRRVRLFQDVFSWQPGESRNQLVQDIEDAIRQLQPEAAKGEKP